MLFGSQPHDESSREQDEHNAPTEPLNSFHSPSYPAGLPGGEPSVLDDILPAPTPLEHPFPALDYAPARPYAHPSAAPVYPVLPPLPASVKNNKRQRPAGGAPPVSPAYPVSPASPFYPVVSSKPIQKVRTKPSLVPSFVGIFFVAVQLLLLVRFVLKLFGLQANIPWVALVYFVSNIFILPFRLVLQNISLPPLPIPTSIELYTLLAILIYGLLSRILVRILQAVLR